MVNKRYWTRTNTNFVCKTNAIPIKQIPYLLIYLLCLNMNEDII